MGEATTGSVSTEAYEVRVVQLQNYRLALEGCSRSSCESYESSTRPIVGQIIKNYPFKIDEYIQQYVSIHQTYE